MSTVCKGRDEKLCCLDTAHSVILHNSERQLFTGEHVQVSLPTSTTMTTLTSTSAWCTSCIESAHSAHCSTLDDDTAHLLAQALSPFIVIHGHTHGAFSLTRSLLSSFTFSSCPSPFFFLYPELFLELDNPIVMASLRYSAAEESEDTLNSFTSHTKQPSVVSRFPGHSALKKIVERRCGGTPSSHSSEHRTGAGSPDSA